MFRKKKTFTDITRNDDALGFFTSETKDVRAVIELKDARTSLNARQKRKKANLQKGHLEVFKLDEHILKNNLYRVDLNPESVKITKQSVAENSRQTLRTHCP